MLGDGNGKVGGSGHMPNGTRLLKSMPCLCLMFCDSVHGVYWAYFVLVLYILDISPTNLKEITLAAQFMNVILIGILRSRLQPRFSPHFPGGWGKWRFTVCFAHQHAAVRRRKANRESEWQRCLIWTPRVLVHIPVLVSVDSEGVRRVFSRVSTVWCVSPGHTVYTTLLLVV